MLNRYSIVKIITDIISNKFENRMICGSKSGIVSREKDTNDSIIKICINKSKNLPDLVSCESIIFFKNNFILKINSKQFNKEKSERLI